MNIFSKIGTGIGLALLLLGCKTNEPNPYAQEPYVVPDNPYSSYPASAGAAPYPQDADYVDVAPVAPPSAPGGSYQPPVYGSQPAYTGPAAPSTPVSPTSGRTYTVIKGDTLYSIGRRHGTTSDRIKQLNGLTSDTIFPGDVLSIP